MNIKGDIGRIYILYSASAPTVYCDCPVDRLVVPMTINTRNFVFSLNASSNHYMKANDTGKLK
jgi:hypothetical protein